MNSVYNTLNKIPFLTASYNLKFLFIAFIGIHIPLIGIIIFIVNNKNDGLSNASIILITLILTLLAAMLTLVILKKLLAPLTASKNALKNFLETNELPQLPTNFEDEAGKLMSLIQKSLLSLDIMGKEKQQLIALVSHNLRTPLNQIKGLCDLMLLDEENRKIYIESVSKISDLQLQSLTELLDQLMHNNFNTEIVKHEFSLSELLKEEVQKIEIEFKNKSLKLEIIDSDKPYKVISDRSKIALIIHNLISNAIKFSFEGQTIIVKIFKKKSKTYLQVIDEGMGFTPEYQKLLFKDARNIGRTGTKDEPSVGLGLHLCKRTITQIDGEILAESKGPNKGATFTIVI